MSAEPVPSILDLDPEDIWLAGIDPDDWKQACAIVRHEEGVKAKEAEFAERMRAAVDRDAEFRAQQEKEEQYRTPVAYEDFFAYMPMHIYLHIPSGGTPWPAASVDARLPPRIVVDEEDVPIKGKDGKIVTIKTSRSLDVHRPVEQMTWWPGKPQLIEHAVFDAGTLLERPGLRIYNTYRPPVIARGDPELAERWLDLVRTLYPAEADHIVAWLAQRVQRPHEKVNHALVLGGTPGIGKDTILDPVRAAVGPWNFADISPVAAMGRFNGFVRSVICRVSEARDLGEVNRFAFYEHMKSYIATPPEVLSCDEKYLRAFYVPNLLGVVMTTNYRTNGIYLPPTDRRHFVAWSERTRGDFTEGFWITFYRWLEEGGGRGHVAAYLRQYDLSRFDPKAAPPQTDAFWAIADANMAPEDEVMHTAIEVLGSPAALIVDDILRHPAVDEVFKAWLNDRRNARQIAHRLETAGYIAVRNEGAAKTGRWKVGGKDRMVYAKADLDLRDRVVAAELRVVRG